MTTDVLGQQTAGDAATGRRARLTMIGGGLGLLAVATLGVALVFWYVGQERARELFNWQVRLGLVAENRSAAVAQWVDSQFDLLNDLSQNASLQLYVTELTLFGADAGLPDEFGFDDAEAAEGAYLRNLLIASAERAGYSADRQTRLEANVAAVGRTGIAIVSVDGQPLVATPDMPPPTSRIREGLARASAGEAVLVDVHLDSVGRPIVGFVAPVYAIQQDANTADPAGFLLAVRPFDADIFALLPQPAEASETAASYLVRRNEGGVEYISPLTDGTLPLARKLALSTPDLAAAFALQQPGGFAEVRNYEGEAVLATGRNVPRTDWVLVRTIDAEEALSGAESRLQTLLVIFVLIIVGVAVAVVAVWRHGTSVRAAQAAQQFREAADRAERLRRFLEVVTDGQPTAIAAVDAEGRYTFANAQAAVGTGIDKAEMIGKTMASVLGPGEAKDLEELAKEALTVNKHVSELQTRATADGHKVLKADGIPLAGTDAETQGVLLILEDITGVVRERERREQTMRNLVGTLVSLVDRRDPFSANQSSRVAEVASAIATEMGLPDELIRTVDVAGNLMNLGKMLVPTEVLTKTGKLSDDELKTIRDSILASADLVDEVKFDLPVSDALRQLQENVDGSGYPKGLVGDDIHICARVVAVANAFVSMVSARSYRAGMPFDKAIGLLMKDAGTRFDWSAVSSLVYHLHNAGGSEKWRHYSDPPPDTAGVA